MGGGFCREKIYAYNLTTQARDGAKEFNTLKAAGNVIPSGLWSDGTTMWVADFHEDKIYAYNLATKAYDETKDFNTLSAAKNNAPEGIWSDDTTMWVVDLDDVKLYAYNLMTKARDTTKDFNTLSAAGNDRPIGLWSDGITMWVADDDDAKLYAYNLATKARDASKDLNTLKAARNNFPKGIWSDGTTMWVTDFHDKKLYAYRPAPDLVSSILLVPLPSTFSSDMSISLTLNATVTNGGIKDASAATTLRYYSSTDPTIEPAADMEIHTEPVTTLATGAEVTYSLNIPTPTTAGDYYYAVCVDTLVMGEFFTSNNCSEVKRVHIYTPLEEVQRTDFNTLSAAGNNHSFGLWSDGTTMWAVDFDDDKLYAYNLATKALDAAKDINTLDAAGNNNPRGLWSDGTTMWVGIMLMTSSMPITWLPRCATRLRTLTRSSMQGTISLPVSGQTAPPCGWRMIMITSSMPTTW